MSEKRKPDPRERVAQVTQRPGKLAQMRTKGKFLHRVRLQREESAKLREAMSRTPVFKQAAWARLVGSTLTALHKLTRFHHCFY